MADQADQQLTQVMAEIKGVLVPHQELELFRKVEDGLRSTDQRRRKEREERQSAIRSLSKQLDDLRRSSTRAAADWRSASEHASEMDKLDTDKFALAKAINEGEARLAAAEAQLRALREEAEECEREEVEEEGFHSEALALKLLRQLGFNPVYENEEISSFIVRSDIKNTAADIDVRSQLLKEGPQARFRLAQQLWEAAS